MKTKLALIGLFTTGSWLMAAAPPENKPMAPEPPPPTITVPAPAPPSTTTTYIVTNKVLTTSAVLVTNEVEVTNAVVITNPLPPSGFVYEQKLYGGRPQLITPEQARAIIDRFRAGYPKLGAPRMLIYVNRELVDEQSGLKLSARSEKTEDARGNVSGLNKGDTNAQAGSITGNVSIAGDVNVNASNVKIGKGNLAYQWQRQSRENIYRLQDRKEMTLEDRQTVRDVERLFGRPLRLGGVSLADQRIATQLLGDKPIKSFAAPLEGEQSRKDREALAKITDVVLEVLISSRNITVPAVSGDQTIPVPDIQATAIRLSDSKIIGQATASDLIGKGPTAGRIARSFDVRDIAEATALSLMEDIMMGVDATTTASAATTEQK